MSPTLDDAKSNKLGTFSGVFTPSMLTIFGVVLFMRANFVIGEAGIIGATLILLVAEAIILLTSFSICAISTNMQIRGGGAYFMISRVLGPTYGGTIGLTLYIAQSLTVVFAVIGFTEAMFSTFPAIPSYFFVPFALITLATLATLATIVYIGANWATKAQFMIMILLAVTVMFMLGGALLNFKVERFRANLQPPAVQAPIGDHVKETQKVADRQIEHLVTDIRHEPRFIATKDLLGYIKYLQEKGTYTFWILFAIYFPAVTGILTGVNMSGDLKDPAKSIPRGTMLAVLIGGVVYFLQIILCGGAFEQHSMIDRPFGILTQNALWGAGFLIVAGMACSSLSSGIGDLMGSPRVLQAVARDRILPILSIFKKGTSDGDEPRRALLLTVMLQVIVIIVIGSLGGGGKALNMIATIVSMLYLWTYGMINIAAFVEKASNNPSFRPTFKYFHWSIALLGAIGCAIAAVMINYAAAIAATLVVITIQAILKRRMLESSFGNALRGYYFQKVRANLIHLLRLPEDDRSWRPTIFALIGQKQNWEPLVTYATWLDNARGIVRTGHVMIGDVAEVNLQRRQRIEEIEEFSQNLDLPIFPMVAVAPTLSEGISILFQAESVRPIRRNLAMFGWGPTVQSFIPQIHWAVHDDLSFLAIKSPVMPDPNKDKRIDLWWADFSPGRLTTGETNHSDYKGPSLSLLLSHLLTRNWEWHHSQLRVIVPVENAEAMDAATQEMNRYIADARLDAEVISVVADGTKQEMLQKHSADADCIFINIGLPAATGDFQQWSKSSTK